MESRQTKQSKFQFSSPLIKKVIFENNDDFNKDKYDRISMSYNIECTQIKNNRSVASLQMFIGESGNAAPFYLELLISAVFTWTDDIQDMSEKLLKQNAVILLLSYARPFVAHITGDAGYRPFNIPFLDVRDDIINME